MNIKYKIKSIKFSDVMIGDFFIYNHDLYLKIDCSQEEINAFNCSKQYLVGINSVNLVKPINIELQEV